MNSLFKYTFLVVLLIIGSCNKIELPAEEMDEVVFNISADSDIGSLNMEAGMDNFVLFPEYFVDNQDVLTFVANFQKDDCQVNCEEKLVFKIRDKQQTIGGNTDIDNAIQVDFYNFEVPLEDTLFYDSLVPKMVLDLDASNSKTENSFENIYTWSFDNGLVTSFINEPNFNEIDLSNFSPNQPFNVQLDLATNGGQGCQSFQKQNLQFQNINKECSVSIQKDTSDTLTAILGSSTPPHLFFWNTNDTAQTIPINPGIDEYSVIYIDGNGCKSSAGITLGPGNEACSAQFSASFRMSNDTFPVMDIEPNFFEFSKVIIEYTTEDGTFYSSEKGAQNGSNLYFEVLSVEDYEDSQIGQKTKKLAIRFACQLFNEEGAFFEFSNGEGIIGMAYPN
ncbi:MAG: hypothetical protein NXI23_15835 [Bacteroidetes bacterium]|jgi:hypothetical protein|nr:hypothetical protein [Bacteroidota bacterium]MDF1867072.1 hypothetical protein [Saprospiraceae bacterium]